MKKLLPVLLVLASCSQSKDQWILESYDKDNGYIFVKDGVQYSAKCFATGIPVLNPNGQPDPDPDSLPVNVASSQEDCGDILAYLHKPVPNLRQVYGTVLLFTDKDNRKLEFTIKQAKPAP